MKTHTMHVPIGLLQRWKAGGLAGTVVSYCVCRTVAQRPDIADVTEHIRYLLVDEYTNLNLTPSPLTDFENLWRWWEAGDTPHTPFAMISTTIVHDLLRGAWDTSLFAVYVAIMSVLGKKRLPCRITYEMLQRRADGYTSSTVPADYVPSLTVSTIRRRIATLEAKSLLHTHSERHTTTRYYWKGGKGRTVLSKADGLAYIAERKAARRVVDREADRLTVEALVEAETRQLERQHADSKNGSMPTAKRQL